MPHPLTGTPDRINTGSWLTGYSVDALRGLARRESIVLPICSLGTSIAELGVLGPLVLPPLYHEAMSESLKGRLLERIRQCFPYYESTRDRESERIGFDVVELPPRKTAATELPGWNGPPRVVAFSVDTAVEEHGPHLPLATDTIQSYGVLDRLATEYGGLLVGPPVEYGHLTWGLPFGFSIDITPALLAEYVTGFANAVVDWLSPEALYVVDVHGSIVHRDAIQEGLAAGVCDRWAFRWLHEPLVEFAGDRGDQHAGGVETALVEHINPRLVDEAMWPSNVDGIAGGQMTLETAIELSGDLNVFIQTVETESRYNGIVGDVRNAFAVDSAEMMGRMLSVARSDVAKLLDAGESTT